jgi:hypothetical protein
VVLTKGSTSIRLGREINAALKSIVYLLISQFTINIFSYVPGPPDNDPRFINAVLDRDDEPPATQIMRGLWKLWMSGAIPATIGEHSICLKPKNTEAKWLVICDVTVTGWMASVPGTFSHSILKDTEIGKIDRVHISAKFDEIKGPLTLEPVSSEEALADIPKKERMAVVMRVRVPRIVSNLGYWPPTAEAIERSI